MEKDKESIKRDADDAKAAMDGLTRDKVSAHNIYTEFYKLSISSRTRSFFFYFFFPFLLPFSVFHLRLDLNEDSVTEASFIEKGTSIFVRLTFFLNFFRSNGIYK